MEGRIDEELAPTAGLDRQFHEYFEEKDVGAAYWEHLSAGTLHCNDEEFFHHGVESVRAQINQCVSDGEYEGVRSTVREFHASLRDEGWGALRQSLRSYAPPCISCALPHLASTAERVVSHGWPALMLAVYDEVALISFWLQAVLHAVPSPRAVGAPRTEADVSTAPEGTEQADGTTSLDGACEAASEVPPWVSGECRWRLIADHWAWVLDGRREDRGWELHRDRDMLEVPHGAAPKYLTLWCALSEAVPANGCMYVLPKQYDPCYHAKGDNSGADGRGSVCVSDVRCVPASTGDVLSWSGRLLHFGGRYDERRAPCKRIAFALALAEPDFEDSLLHGIEPLEMMCDGEWGWRVRFTTVWERLYACCIQCILYEDNVPLCNNVRRLLNLFERATGEEMGGHAK